MPNFGQRHIFREALRRRWNTIEKRKDEQNSIERPKRQRRQRQTEKRNTIISRRTIGPCARLNQCQKRCDIVRTAGACMCEVSVSVRECASNASMCNWNGRMTVDTFYFKSQSSTNPLAVRCAPVLRIIPNSKFDAVAMWVYSRCTRHNNFVKVNEHEYMTSKMTFNSCAAEMREDPHCVNIIAIQQQTHLKKNDQKTKPQQRKDIHWNAIDKMRITKRWPPLATAHTENHLCYAVKLSAHKIVMRS